jgi:hypothetical protein
VDAALKFALEDRAEKARTATRDAMLGTQALAASSTTSAADSACPADGIHNMKCCCAAGSRELDVTIHSRETVSLLPVEVCL